MSKFVNISFMRLFVINSPNVEPERTLQRAVLWFLAAVKNRFVRKVQVVPVPVQHVPLIGEVVELCTVHILVRTHSR